MEFLTTALFSAHQCATALCATHMSLSNKKILFAATKQLLYLLLN